MPNSSLATHVRQRPGACPRTTKRPVSWYRRAAEQGYADAQDYLGAMYNYGWGVPENDAEAAKWWRKAAEQGLATGEYHLGGMYRFGAGLPKDHKEAVKLVSHGRRARASLLPNSSSVSCTSNGRGCPPGLPRGRAVGGARPPSRETPLAANSTSVSCYAHRPRACPRTIKRP